MNTFFAIGIICLILGLMMAFGVWCIETANRGKAEALLRSQLQRNMRDIITVASDEEESLSGDSLLADAFKSTLHEYRQV